MRHIASPLALQALVINPYRPRGNVPIAFGGKLAARRYCVGIELLNTMMSFNFLQKHVPIKSVIQSHTVYHVFYE